MNTNHWLVGRRVLNIHRQSCDYSQEFRDAHKGTVLGVEEGCNAIIWVQFDGSGFHSPMIPSDLAFCELWPQEGCRVVLDLPAEVKTVKTTELFKALRDRAIDAGRSSEAKFFLEAANCMEELRQLCSDARDELVQLSCNETGLDELIDKLTEARE